MRRIVFREKLRIFLKSRSATSCICDDRVKIGGQKNVLIRARQIAGDIPNPCVRCERAATDLIARDDHFTAIGLQDANGGSIQLAECDLRDAAREKSDAGAADSLGWKRLAEIREKEIRIDLGHQ